MIQQEIEQEKQLNRMDDRNGEIIIIINNNNNNNNNNIIMNFI